MTKEKFYAVNGPDKTEIEADSIVLETPDGEQFELMYRPHDQVVALYAKNTLVICPRASNLIHLKEGK